MPDLPPIDGLATARRLFAPLASAPFEIVAVAFLDPKWRILGCRHRVGGLTQTRLPIRQVVRDALAFDAAGVVLAHNHPGGDPTPSVRDLGYTRALARTLAVLDVVLHDHLVLAGIHTVSLRERGVL